MSLVVKKKVKNGVLYEGDFEKQMTVRVDNVRISFPHVGKPWAKNPEKEQEAYSCGGILDKEDHAEAIELINKVINKMAAANDMRLPPSKLALKDGDSPENTKEEYRGAWYFNARETKNLPTAKKKTPKGMVNLTPEQAEREIYGGCYGSILFRLWPQDNEWGKRINAGLLGVVFLRDGESFGESRIDDSDAYDDLDDSDGGFGDIDDEDDL